MHMIRIDWPLIFIRLDLSILIFIDVSFYRGFSELISAKPFRDVKLYLFKIKQASERNCTFMCAKRGACFFFFLCQTANLKVNGEFSSRASAAKHQIERSELLFVDIGFRCTPPPPPKRLFCLIRQPIRKVRPYFLLSCNFDCME